jgi:hypothetical protein
MDYINKKLNELRLLTSFKKRNSTASVILKLDSPNEDLDIISLPSCSKSDEEHSNGSNNSTENSISSLIGKRVRNKLFSNKYFGIIYTKYSVKIDDPNTCCI